MNVKLVIVIPCYRHAHILQNYMALLCSYQLPIMIIDDGGNAEQKTILQQLVVQYSQVQVITNPTNLGKGGAMSVGFTKAYELGFTHVLQIDADGQLDYGMIPTFHELAKKHPQELICGKPQYLNVPKLRFISRYITHFWVAIELGMCKVVDTMCGLRVYPLDPVLKIMQKRELGTRMAFDTEIFIRLYWAGVDYREQEVPVQYPEHGISNFAPLHDNVLISWMHTKLCYEKSCHWLKIHNRHYY